MSTCVHRLDFADCSFAVYEGSRGCTIEMVAGKQMVLASRDEVRALRVFLERLEARLAQHERRAAKLLP